MDDSKSKYELARDFANQPWEGTDQLIGSPAKDDAGQEPIETAAEPEWSGAPGEPTF